MCLITEFQITGTIEKRSHIFVMHINNECDLIDIADNKIAFIFFLKI